MYKQTNIYIWVKYKIIKFIRGETYFASYGPNLSSPQSQSNVMEQKRQFYISWKYVICNWTNITVSILPTERSLRFGIWMFLFQCVFLYSFFIVVWGYEHRNKTNITHFLWHLNASNRVILVKLRKQHINRHTHIICVTYLPGRKSGTEYSCKQLIWCEL